MNLTKTPQLGRSQAQGQSDYYLAQWTQYQTVLQKVILHPQMSAALRLAPEKLLCGADGGQCRNSQLVQVQRASVSHKWGIYIIPILLQKRGRKILRASSLGAKQHSRHGRTRDDEVA